MSRGGFGSYQEAPGLTAIDEVRAVLGKVQAAPVVTARMLRSFCSDLDSAGLEHSQAIALIMWADRVRGAAL